MKDKQQGRHRRRADKGSLPGLASRALGWSFASNLIARVGTLPIGIVLARLLGPHAFGTYAVALVALVALLSFNDLSVSLAIVRWKGDPAQIAPALQRARESIQKTRRSAVVNIWVDPREYAPGTKNQTMYK